MEMLGAKGLGDVVQQFKDKGLGDVVTSWVGKGPNLPISAEQVKAALGPESLEAWRRRSGFRPVRRRPCSRTSSPASSTS